VTDEPIVPSEITPASHQAHSTVCWCLNDSAECCRLNCTCHLPDEITPHWAGNLGRAVGNWNDRTLGTDGAGDVRRLRRWAWLRINRVAGWLYVRGER
jgi:hypothetical protein